MECNGPLEGPEGGRYSNFDMAEEECSTGRHGFCTAVENKECEGKSYYLCGLWLRKSTTKKMKNLLLYF